MLDFPVLQDYYQIFWPVRGTPIINLKVCYVLSVINTSEGLQTTGCLGLWYFYSDENRRWAFTLSWIDVRHLQLKGQSHVLKQHLLGLTNSSKRLINGPQQGPALEHLDSNCPQKKNKLIKNIFFRLAYVTQLLKYVLHQWKTNKKYGKIPIFI